MNSAEQIYQNGIQRCRIMKEIDMKACVKKLIKACLLIGMIPAGYAAQVDDAAQPRVRLDEVYKNTAHGELKLDLYYPEAPKTGIKYPVVVYTHGGGWNKGNKNIGEQGIKREFVDGLNALGFCVASVQYRLCVLDGIKMRDCVTDSKDAVRFLAKNADRLFVDAQNVFTLGDSAGGHIAQMLLLSPTDSFVGDPALADASYRMTAGISWYGPCDFEKVELFRRGDEAVARNRFEKRILRGDESPEEKLAALREVSPVNYLKPDSPPLLMMQGDQDPTIPVYHAHYMKERAEAIDAPVEKYIVENSSHGWNERGGTMRPTRDDIVTKTVSFMKEQLDLSAL
jgi:acetyl esterase/lipase